MRLKTNCNEIAFAGVSQSLTDLWFYRKIFLFFFLAQRFVFGIFIAAHADFDGLEKLSYFIIIIITIELRVLLFSFATAPSFHSPHVRIQCYSTFLSMNMWKIGNLHNPVDSINGNNSLMFPMFKRAILIAAATSSSDWITF